MKHWLYAKLWRFELDQSSGHDDYQVFLGKNYIGLICSNGIINTYQMVLDGRGIGGSEKLRYAKIKFIWKYYITRLFGV